MPQQDPLPIETNDLGLATYLAMHGHGYTTEWRTNDFGPVCWWLFSNADEKANLLYDDWIAHQAMANLRTYNAVFGRLKKEMLRSRPK